MLSKLHDLQQKCIIAIDGTSASGKGTIAKIMAKRFELVHYQSSILYRYLALCAVQRGIEHHDTNAIIALSKELASHDINDSQSLYDEEVTQTSSILAAIPEVRKNLYHMQRELLSLHPRIIMDGRDIGTVIAPEADIKIFITADSKMRAQRRYDQLIGNGHDVIYDDILRQIKERDERDTNRSIAPLKPSTDAIILDTTDISADEAVEKLLVFMP